MFVNMNCVRAITSTGRYIIKIKSTARCISNHPMKFVEAQDRWREMDNVSKRWKLIYRAPMDNVLNFVTTYLTFTTGTIGLSGLYYGMFVFDQADLNNPVLLGDNVVIANDPIECIVYLGSFIAFHVAVKVLLSKYVIRLYQDGDDYLAVFRGHIYNSIKKHKFHLNEFKKLNPTFVVTWGDGRFSLGEKHGILLENYFKTPQHFHYLLYKKGKQKLEDDDD
ncbi:uncharacterized protein LOC114245484 [Bombyx mandarina]|uniref:Uncharacterized protein LOC114245484 n=1 Tax=Bombyx mandarina TaxID=7092 RepID=A0A6J2JVR0_BOMMA|nr:uncharacterized protein LOC114245484 [Bombyx mandarina]